MRQTLKRKQASGDRREVEGHTWPWPWPLLPASASGALGLWAPGLIRSQCFWSSALRRSMDTLGFEPRDFRMRSGCDTTTPCAQLKDGRLWSRLEKPKKLGGTGQKLKSKLGLAPGPCVQPQSLEPWALGHLPPEPLLAVLLPCS